MCERTMKRHKMMRNRRPSSKTIFVGHKMNRKIILITLNWTVAIVHWSGGSVSMVEDPKIVSILVRGDFIEQQNRPTFILNSNTLKIKKFSPAFFQHTHTHTLTWQRVMAPHNCLRHCEWINIYFCAVCKMTVAAQEAAAADGSMKGRFTLLTSSSLSSSSPPSSLSRQKRTFCAAPLEIPTPKTDSTWSPSLVKCFRSER